MTTLATETWTGTTGAAWPAQWTTTGSTGISATIQANRGRQTVPTSSSAYKVVIDTLSLAARADTDVLVTFLPQTTPAEQYAMVRVRGTGTGTQAWDPSTGYQLWLTFNGSTGSTIQLKKTSAGTTSALGTGTTAIAWSTTGITVRVQAIGTTIRYKAWVAGGAEPGSWTETFTDSTATSGQVALVYTGAFTNASTSFAEWDDLTVTDGATGGSGSIALVGTGSLGLSGSGVKTGSGSVALAGTGALGLSGSGAKLGSGSIGLTGTGSLGLSGSGSGSIRVSTLTDDFTTLDSTKWSFDANASIVSGRLQLSTSTLYRGATAAQTYDLTNSSASVEMVQTAGPSSATVDTTFGVIVDANNQIYFTVEAAFLYFQCLIGGTYTDVGTPIRYDATSHRWLRLVHNGTTIVWQTSPDFVVWTTQATWTPTFAVTAVKPVLQTGYYDVVSSPGVAVFDNFNVAVGSGAVALTGSGALTLAGVAGPAGALALTGTGSLLLSGSGVAGTGTGALAFVGNGALSLVGVGAGETLVFRPPIYQRRMPIMPGLAALMNYSVALLRINGQWVETEFPSEQQINAADIYLPGGYENVVNSVTARALTDAGYNVSGFSGAAGSGSLVLTGSGSLALAPALTGSGTLALTGSGSLSFAPAGSGTIALTGSGTLSLAASAPRLTKIDATQMSGPYYTMLPATPIIDANNSAKVATLASAAGKFAGLKWVTACFATTTDPSYSIVYDQDPQEQAGGAYTWALNQPSFRTTGQVRIPDAPNFYTQPGDYSSGAGWDGWGCVIDPASGVGWAGWRMVKNGASWQATTAHSFPVPGSLTSVTSGLARGDGLPIIAGSITVQEAAAAAADTTGTYVFPHALSIAVPQAMVDSAFRAPATKTDGTVTPTTSTLSEGSRLYLPASAVISTTNKLMKAVFRTLQTYGCFITDRTGGNSITLNFERFDPANPNDMIDPANGQASTPGNANAIAGAYYRAGFTFDFYDLSPIPWSSLQLCKQSDGGGTGTAGPASGLGAFSGNGNPLQGVTESFTTKDTNNGFYDVGASVVSGQLNLAVHSTYDGTWTANPLGDLTNSFAQVQLVQAPNVGNGTTELSFSVKLDNSNSFGLRLSGGVLSFTTQTAGVTTQQGSAANYSATAHKYLRVRHNGSQVVAETSADKTTWAQVGSAWTPTFSITSLRILLNAGFYGTEPSPGTAIFDNVNL